MLSTVRAEATRTSGSRRQNAELPTTEVVSEAHASPNVWTKRKGTCSVTSRKEAECRGQIQKDLETFRIKIEPEEGTDSDFRHRPVGKMPHPGDPPRTDKSMKKRIWQRPLLNTMDEQGREVVTVCREQPRVGCMPGAVDLYGCAARGAHLEPGRDIAWRPLSTAGGAEKEGDHQGDAKCRKESSSPEE